jgi:hypothetical protein
MIYKDYRKAIAGDNGEFLDVLYNDAVATVEGIADRDNAIYNAAMFAARRLGGALLDEAQDAGVTDEQYQRLAELVSKLAHD